MMRMQIQLVEDQASELRRASAATGRSMASLIREAVDHMSFRGGGDLAWERAMDALGCAASGRSDVGAEHDRHLAEAYASSLRSVSFVDWASFALMRDQGITEALAFDQPFRAPGLYTAPRLMIVLENNANHRRRRITACRRCFQLAARRRDLHRAGDAHDGLGGKLLDQPSGARVAAGVAGAGQPLCSQAIDHRGEPPRAIAGN